MMPDSHARWHGDENLAAHKCVECGDPREERLDLCDECERFFCADCMTEGLCADCAKELAE